MPLVFLAVFGGALLIYMGWKNESLQGILQDTLKPISGPAPTLDNSSQSYSAAPAVSAGIPGTPNTGASSNPLFGNPLAPPQKSGLFGALFGRVVPKISRHDQGRDLQVQSGQNILAPGSGYLIRNGNDPNGFGISYPIVHFYTGPWAGLDVYFGHIKSAFVSPGESFLAGTPLGQTQNGTGSYVGNATGLPGWVEIGRAPGGNPGPFGQSLLPGL